MSEFKKQSENFTRRSAKAAPQRKKFATQMDEQLLNSVRAFAKQEGRQLQAVLEDAVDLYLTEKGYNRAEPDVLDMAHGVMGRFSETLKYLAK